MKRIGIVADVNLETSLIYNSVEAQMVAKDLVEVIQKLGHLPIMIPLGAPELADHYLDLIDALVLPGGNDIHPIHYQQSPHPMLGLTYESRDEMELALVKAAYQKGLPILGICRGMQLVNIALGGSLYQDLGSQYDTKLIQHRQRAKADQLAHAIEIEVESFCGKLFGASTYVNSLHHQAIHTLAPGFKVTARAADRIIEAMEHETLSILLVQWHPENLWRKRPEQFRLFETFFK